MSLIPLVPSKDISRDIAFDSGRPLHVDMEEKRQLYKTLQFMPKLVIKNNKVHIFQLL